MPAGRPRKPTRLKALAGETRRERLQVEPQPRETEPEPPDWLSEAARRVWDQVTLELAGMGMLFAADTWTVAAFCSSWALVETAERGLAEEGYATRDDHGRAHRSNWLMVRRDGVDGVHKFGMALGLSPSARARLDVSPQRPLDDDELLAARLLDGPGRLLSH